MTDPQDALAETLTDAGMKWQDAGLVAKVVPADIARRVCKWREGWLLWQAVGKFLALEPERRD